MALSSPLGVAQFWEKLQRIARVRFWPREVSRVDRTAGGVVLKASLGNTVWMGSLELRDDPLWDRAAEIDALISVASRPGMAFLAYDPRKPYPAADPDGSILGVSSPQIASLDANNREMTLSGLPAGYVLTAGDMIGWQYGSSPTRYALHRLVTGATADGTGTTPAFEVTPFIQPGVSVGTAVTLVKPVMKAVLDVEPQFGGAVPGVVEGARFEFVQTMR